MGPLYETFALIAWKNWNCRNLILFGEMVVGFSAVVNKINVMADDVFMVYNQLVVYKRRGCLGELKASTDGFGGWLIRDANGCWVHGFGACWERC